MSKDFHDPVLATDGNIYEREEIMKMISEQIINPFTEKLFEIEDIQPDNLLQLSTEQQQDDQSSQINDRSKFLAEQQQDKQLSGKSGNINSSHTATTIGTVAYPSKKNWLFILIVLIGISLLGYHYYTAGI
ncbi:unnamed protein product [Adineta steineri]|uniref:U-box domain-containing protein n=1 Tax=Adineta steineri TaxID=433720 RepID=A0A819D8B0_9BILA|nr:unnamed protein product [Adineta steineri]CAF3829280.1 unnamed protein product [Adineta steineri]